MFSEYFRERKHAKRKYRGEMFTRVAIEDKLQGASQSDIRKYLQCPPVIPTHDLTVHSIKCTNDPIFIAGNNHQNSQSPL